MEDVLGELHEDLRKTLENVIREPQRKIERSWKSLKFRGQL